MGILGRFRLDDRVAVVTGASSGLGVAFAQALAEAGADVALGARRVDRLEETRELVTAAGRQAIAVETDVAEPADCARLVERTMQQFGRLDILVNNAGTQYMNTHLRTAPDEFRRVIDVNLNGCAWMAQEAARVMQPGSAIVNISSALGLKGTSAPQAAYTAAKAGLLGLTRDLAQQWTGRHGIRVNALAPGFVKTELTADYDDDLDAVTGVIPSGRVGRAEEIAAALLFLVSDAASYVTGQTLVVDGGFTIV